jgi:hypothetical protein
MKPIPFRVQMTLVAAGYAAVLAAAAVLVCIRYMQYVSHPQDVAAAGGMYAGGDLFLEMFIACIFLVPTLLLALVIRKSENLYIGYSKILLGLSLTAPICLGVLSIPAVNQGTMILGELLMARLFASPFVMVGLGFSRLLARFDRAKRLTSYALMIEILTLVFMAALFLFLARAHRS